MRKHKIEAKIGKKGEDSFLADFGKVEIMFTIFLNPLTLVLIDKSLSLKEE